MRCGPPAEPESVARVECLPRRYRRCQSSCCFACWNRPRARVDGIRLQHLGLTYLRQMVGAVPQDDQLFSGSIADNFSFFDPPPSQDRI